MRLKIPLKLIAKRVQLVIKLMEHYQKLVWDIAGFGNCPPETWLDSPEALPIGEAEWISNSFVHLKLTSPQKLPVEKTFH